VSLAIAPAAASDAGVILALIRELADYEKLAHAVTATEEQVAASLFGERPEAEVRIARWDGEPAGFALFFMNYSTFLGRKGIYLEDLFVRAPLRGRGIGRALLADVARTALARGCGRLDWAVLDWNQPAIGFYTKLGATPMSDWTVFRLEGAALARLAR